MVARLYLLIEEQKEEKNCLLKLSKLPTIKKSFTFKKVYKYGLSIKSNGFVLRFLQNDEFEFRLNSKCVQFGFVLSKKLGSSVKRNYIKRRLKNAVSKCIKDFHISGYYIFIAESRLSSVAYKDLVSNIEVTLKILHKTINKNVCSS